jgi:hypothetical protein
MTTNPQIKILDELKEIKDEIIEFGKTREIGDIIDIGNTMNALKSANDKVIELINVLTEIKNRLNIPLMSLAKDEHKVSSS